jgi:hypothetical protein
LKNWSNEVRQLPDKLLAKHGRQPSDIDGDMPDLEYRQRLEQLKLEAETYERKIRMNATPVEPIVTDCEPPPPLIHKRDSRCEVCCHYDGGLCHQTGETVLPEWTCEDFHGWLCDECGCDTRNESIHERVMEFIGTIERDCTQSDDADATINAIIRNVQRFRKELE